MEINQTSHQITQLLGDWSEGDMTAPEQLMPLVYDELKRMAKRFMNRQDPGHTLQTTELIHEAYLKIAGQDEKHWQNRLHFYGVASQAMRHILVDYARAKISKKRGGSRQRITFIENKIVSNNRSGDLVALDEALEKLCEFDERKGRVVEMKFFGGLQLQEIAEVLKVSRETVKRDWRFSRNWLLNELAKK